MAQTQKEIEIILVDDGSTDSSDIMCDSYAQKNAKVKVIHQENKGLVSDRKAGMRCAKGEYIYNLDGDDWIESNMLERLLSVAAETHADYVQSGFIRESIHGATKSVFLILSYAKI